MKIAQVTPYFLPVEGGVERHVLNLSRGLMSRGHDVRVFTCARTRQNELLERSSRLEGIEVSRFDSMMRLGEFGTVWPGFAAEVARGDFDVIHAHSFRHPHTDLSMLVSKFSGSASVLTTHSPFHPSNVRGPFARALVPIYDHLVAPTTLCYFDKVISLTTEEASVLEGMGVPHNRTVVIPHGIEPRHFASTDSLQFRQRHCLGDRDFILSLGRINRTKGLDILLEAFSKVASELPSPVVVIAGGCTSPKEDEFLRELKARTTKLGLEGRVVFTGRLTEDEKASALDGCAFFVLPSRYEPYGIVLLEAAAHGKALVATREGGPGSIVKEGVNGFLVPPGDADALSQAISVLASDSRRAVQMGERARELALQHTWESVAEMTEAAYLSCSAGGVT